MATETAPVRASTHRIRPEVESAMNRFPAPSTARPEGQRRAEPDEQGGTAESVGDTEEIPGTVRKERLRVSTSKICPVAGEETNTLVPSGVTARLAGDETWASVSSRPVS